MADENITLKQGLLALEKALETALNEQRRIAHGAIDMDDWNKAQEILAAAKKNISAVEELRAGFTECKKRVLAVDLVSELSALGVKLPVNSDADGSLSADRSSDAPAAENDTPETKTAAVSEGSSKPAENAASGFSFADELENLIAQFPFRMAVANAAAGVGELFTYDELEKNDMKAPEQLSNGLWADTGVPEDKARGAIDALKEYCKQG